MDEEVLTVEELIELLKELDPQARVYALNCRSCRHGVTGIDTYRDRVYLEIDEFH